MQRLARVVCHVDDEKNWVSLFPHGNSRRNCVLRRNYLDYELRLSRMARSRSRERHGENCNKGCELEYHCRLLILPCVTSTTIVNRPSRSLSVGGRPGRIP